jgi:hypothetical protein
VSAETQALLGWDWALVTPFCIFSFLSQVPKWKYQAGKENASVGPFISSATILSLSLRSVSRTLKLQAPRLAQKKTKRFSHRMV